MLVGGMPFSISLPFSSCVVPSGITGPVAIYVTNDTQPLNNNARDRFLGDIVAGPTMAFIDNDPEQLGALVRTVSGGSSSSDSSEESTSTATISPAAASSLLASASASAAPSSSTGATSLSGLPSLSNNIGGLSVPSTADTVTGPSSDGSLTVDGWAAASK